MLLPLLALAATAGAPPILPRSAILGPQTLAAALATAAANHRRYDANGDGYVTREELAAFVRRMMGGLPMPGIDAAHPLPPASEAIFAAADTDHDGRVSLAETLAGARRQFAREGADQDGVVSQAERMALITRNAEELTQQLAKPAPPRP